VCRVESLGRPRTEKQGVPSSCVLSIDLAGICRIHQRKKLDLWELVLIFVLSRESIHTFGSCRFQYVHFKYTLRDALLPEVQCVS
jgi:hypothetical protein